MSKLFHGSLLFAEVGGSVIQNSGRVRLPGSAQGAADTGRDEPRAIRDVSRRNTDRLANRRTNNYLILYFINFGIEYVF